MIEIAEVEKDCTAAMHKAIDAFKRDLLRVRTGRANLSLLDDIKVEYYGTPTPLNQVASVTVEDARTLVISPWEKKLVPDIEKAILKSDIGITPASTSDVVRVPLPSLTEQNRKDLAKQARHEAENARIAIRNIRRDAINDIRELVKEKEVAEDEAHRGEEAIQKLTDRRIAEVDEALAAKETDLMEV